MGVPIRAWRPLYSNEQAGSGQVPDPTLSPHERFSGCGMYRRVIGDLFLLPSFLTILLATSGPLLYSSEHQFYVERYYAALRGNGWVHSISPRTFSRAHLSHSTPVPKSTPCAPNAAQYLYSIMFCVCLFRLLLRSYERFPHIPLLCASSCIST